jgi:hypothetical protein
MIAFKNNLPLVRFDDGQVIAFETSWLARGLTRAAAQAGYNRWWLAGHVAESVVAYLERDFTDNTVGLERLRTAVQSVLQVIGYADIADAFEPLPPPVRLSLAALAHEAGSGYELTFFHLLRDRLREIVNSNAVQAELRDLAPCVKMLRSAKIWRRDCTGLRTEIVRFVRGSIDESHRAAELQLELS